METTRELTVPLPEALRLAAERLRGSAATLKRQLKQAPDGQVVEFLNGVIIRIVAQADVLGEKAIEIQKHWPTTAVDR